LKKQLPEMARLFTPLLRNEKTNLQMYGKRNSTYENNPSPFQPGHCFLQTPFQQNVQKFYESADFSHRRKAAAQKTVSILNPAAASFLILPEL